MKPFDLIHAMKATPIGRCVPVGFLLAIAFLPGGRHQTLAQDSMLGGDDVTLFDQFIRRSVDPKSVEKRLNDLIQSTEQMRNQLGRSASPEVLEEPNDRLEPAQPAPPTSTDNRLGLSDIHERIRLLKRLRESQAATSSAFDITSRENPFRSMEPQVGSPTTDGPRETVQGEAPPEPRSSGQDSSPADPLDPKFVTIESNLAPQTHPAEDDSAADLPTQAFRILDSPVNAVELAHSLYRTKNYVAALKAIQSVDLAALSVEEQTWLELLSALCQRRLGEGAAAEGHLREIANTKSTDYSVSVARWWLSQTEARGQSEMTAESLELNLEKLMERARQYGQY